MLYDPLCRLYSMLYIIWNKHWKVWYALLYNILWQLWWTSYIQAQPLSSPLLTDSAVAVTGRWQAAPCICRWFAAVRREWCAAKQLTEPATDSDLRAAGRAAGRVASRKHSKFWCGGTGHSSGFEVGALCGARHKLVIYLESGMKLPAQTNKVMHWHLYCHLAKLIDEWSCKEVQHRYWFLNKFDQEYLL